MSSDEKIVDEILVSTDTLIFMSDEDEKVAQEDCDDFVILSENLDEKSQVSIAGKNDESDIIAGLMDMILIIKDDDENGKENVVDEGIEEGGKNGDVWDLVEKLKRENRELKEKIATLEEEKILFKMNDLNKSADPELLSVSTCSDFCEEIYPETDSPFQLHTPSEFLQPTTQPSFSKTLEEKLTNLENENKETEQKIPDLNKVLNDKTSKTQEKQLEILSSFYKTERLRCRLAQENLKRCEEILQNFSILEDKHSKFGDAVNDDQKKRLLLMLDDIVDYIENDKKTPEGSSQTNAGSLEEPENHFYCLSMKQKLLDMSIGIMYLEENLAEAKAKCKKMKRSTKNKMRLMRRKIKNSEVVLAELEEQIENLQKENKKLKKKTKKFYMIQNR